MKSLPRLLPVFVVLTVLVAVAACDKDNPLPLRKDAVRLGSCSTIVFDKSQVKICYNKLISDSRCPAGVVCVWEGVAAGEFTFYEGGNTHKLTLATMKYGPYSSDIMVGNYRIQLISIDPYPGEKDPRPAGAVVKVTKQ